MKILYGVQGTGNGHITRARAMAKCFSEKKLVVDFIFSGRPSSEYFDMEVFGHYQAFQGLTFATEGGQVQLLDTLKGVNVLSFVKDVKNLDVSGYDLIINDFEPISAWAGKLAGKKVINISHQASFYDPLVPILSRANLHRLFLKTFAPSTLSLGVHWYPFSGRILPPFVEVAYENKQRQSFHLVYLPFEDLDEILALTTLFMDEDFIIYHPDVNTPKQQENSLLKQPNRMGFIHDLQISNGVICNAGFELSSEALTLGKKLLIKPLGGQFEQASNATVLGRSKRATLMTFLNEDTLDQWLNVKAQSKVNFPSDPTPLVDWLIEGNYQEPEILCQKLWKEVDSVEQQVAN